MYRVEERPGTRRCYSDLALQADLGVFGRASDKSVWDIEIQSKRTGFNPKGNWAASGASAAAFEASDEDL